MPLSPGTRLGHYEVVGPLGEGGMGVVYRAHDTTLDRTVALKLLPEAFAHDPDRLARFDREAKMLAALNHPCIAQIYGVQETAGLSSGAAAVRALVMELVDGPTLDERLRAVKASGSAAGLPLEDVLPIARQLADALEAAHEQGIVHRDLKPSNVKVRTDGTVKVLDFGLAKLTSGDGGHDSREAMTASPTITSPMLMTGAGIILGTAAYMAPEQARGKTVDKRADIWAFGCVVYELVTGRRAFGGDDVADTMVAVLSREPDWSALSREADSTLGPLLRRCLVKDPKRRLRDIGEARLAIDGVVDGNAVADSGPPLSSNARPPLKQLLPWVAASAVITAAAIAAVGVLLRPAQTETIAVRATIQLPERARPLAGFGAQNFAISPDGRTIALILADADGQRHLWIRSLDSLAARMLRGTEGAIAPFWRPDSRWIGFATDGKLQRVEVGGGLPVTICNIRGNALGFSAGTWARDGTVLFSTLGSGGILRAPEAGGDALAVTHVDEARGELNHSQVSFLPDGRHFLYYAGGQGEPIGLFVGSLDSPDRVRLLERGSRARYAAGHLFFTRDKDLVAQPFNLDRLAFEGDVVPVADTVNIGGALAASGAFSVSTDGVVIYQGASVERRVRLEWFDRKGARVGSLGDEGLYSEPELSPDSSRTAFVIGANDTSRGDEIWIYDNVRGTRARLTTGLGDKVAPRWSPNSSTVAFASRKLQGSRVGWLRMKPIAAAEDSPLVEDESNRGIPSSWSRDDRFLLFTAPDRSSEGRIQGDIWVLPLKGERKPAKFIATPFNEGGGTFSPDGRHVAFHSDRTGRDEVYVTTFPDATDPVTISASGGSWPQWRQDGRELFYLSADGQLMTVDVTPGSPVRFGMPHVLFKVAGSDTTNSSPKPYSPTSDGQRFIVATTVEQGDVAPLTVLIKKW
jgi:Tol biopolymer transport system component